MESRALGNSGLMVPALGLGTVKLGRNRDVSYPEAFDLPSDRQVDVLLETAIEQGVLLWDTAPAYGQAEERIGSRLPRVRERVVLCTKAGESYGAGGSRHDFSAAGIRTSVETSLRRLRTDVIDICLLHSDGRDREILQDTDAVQALEQLREEGKLRAMGMSAKTSDGILLASQLLDVVMAPFSRRFQELGPALRAARARGCGVLVIKVLDQGHGVADAPSSVEGLRDALAFVLGDDAVDAAVIGTRSPSHLREAARAASEVLHEMRGGGT